MSKTRSPFRGPRSLGQHLGSWDAVGGVPLNDHLRNIHGVEPAQDAKVQHHELHAKGEHGNYPV